MIETDSHGQPLEVDDLDAEWLLDFAHEAEAEVRKAERRRLRVVLRWCDLHPAVDDDHRLSWGEQERQWDCDAWIGGEGVPAVAEFCAERLAAVLRMSPAATTQPDGRGVGAAAPAAEIHARVESFDVALWRARRVAKATQGLSPEAAGHVDAVLAAVVDSVGPTRIDRAVADAVALFDPSPSRPPRRTPSSTSGASRCATVGLVRVVSRAGHLVAGDHRRHPHPEAAARPDRRHHRPAADPGLRERPRARQIEALDVVLDRLGAPRPRVRLAIEITADDLTDTDPDAGSGVGQVLGLGPATIAKIRDWLTGSR